MAFVLEAANNVKQRSLLESRRSGPADSLRALWKWMAQVGNPDLKFKAFSGLKSTDVVVSDAPCTLYAIFASIPSTATVDSWLKISDHATTAAAAADVVIKITAASLAGKQTCPIFIDGLVLGTGATIGSHTANNGNTKSELVDAATGFVIVGA